MKVIEFMAYDYKNPTPPRRGDGRYESKYPNNYQVLDLLREYHYEMFGCDLNFNGNKDRDYFHCCEEDIYAYANATKFLANEKSNNKKPIFSISTEKGIVGDENQYFEMAIKKEIFMGDKSKDVLEYIKKCIKELSCRDFNVVISDDEMIEFIHVPEMRDTHGLCEFGCDYTTNEFMRWLRMYYEHCFFYLEYVDPSLVSMLTPLEKEWLEKIMIPKAEKLDEIEVGQKLSYINIQKKNSN